MTGTAAAKAPATDSELAAGAHDERGRPLWPSVVGGTLVVVALLPFVRAIVVAWNGDYLPVGDSAIIDLRVRDVWTGAFPLTGAYSRYGWSHPGPLLHWMLAALSKPMGGAPWSVLVAAVLLQAGAIVWLARLAWKVGRLPTLTLWMCIVMLAYAGTGSWMLVEVWNPYVAFPFFALFLLHTWLIFRGDASRLVGAVVVGTLLVQSHIGYAPLVVPLLAVGIAVVWRDARRRSSSLWATSTVRWAALVGLVLWLPPLVEGLLRPPGNLVRLASATANGNGSDPAVGLRSGTELLAAAVRPWPSWLGGVAPLENRWAAGTTSTWLWFVPLALILAGLFVRGRRMRRPLVTRSVALLVVLLALSVVTLAGVAGTPFHYLVQWRLVVGSCTLVMTIWLLADAAGLLELRMVRAAAFVVAAATVCAGAAELDSGLAGRDPIWPLAPAVHQLSVKSAPEAGDDALLLRYAGPAEEGVHASLVNELLRRNVDVGVEEDLGFVFGEERVRGSGEADQVWFVAEDGATVSLLTQRPGSWVVAESTPLAPDEELELRLVQRRLTARANEAGRPDLVARLSAPDAAAVLAELPGVQRVDLDRLTKLNAEVAQSRTCRCAVVGFAPADAPN